MKPADKIWQRLLAASHRAPSEPEASAPFGFATRVVALAFEKQRIRTSPLERLALRALGVSCLLAALGAVSSYTLLNQPTTNNTSVDAYFTGDDPASIVLDTAP